MAIFTRLFQIILGVLPIFIRISPAPSKPDKIMRSSMSAERRTWRCCGWRRSNEQANARHYIADKIGRPHAEPPEGDLFMRTYAFAIAVAALLALGAAVLLIVPTSGSHVASAVRIHREIADVFAFFTTPKNWPRWHPASISVAGAMDHSLAVGEEVTEEFRMGSRERASGLARHRKERAFSVAHRGHARKRGCAGDDHV